MNNEPNKPIPAQELTEKELEGVSGGSRGAAGFSQELINIEYHASPGWGQYASSDIAAPADLYTLKGIGAALT